MTKTLQLSYDYSTAEKGQKTPFFASYEFSKTFNIDENKLPFMKPIVLFNKTPLSVHEGCMHFQPYYYSDTHYWKIYGDSTLIYKGETPSNRFKSENERLEYAFNSSLCSKWFYGDLKYTTSGDEYEIKNSWIYYIKTYYDVNLVETMSGVFRYNWKSFECSAIDAISSTAVQGTGTLRVSTMVEGPPGNWSQQIETTKNVTQTVPLFEDVTHINVQGTRYLNGSYDRHVNQETIKFKGNLIIGTTISPQSDAGWADLISFAYSWSSSSYTKFWRLWWDNNRACEFLFNTSQRIPMGLPSQEFYESTNLPYTTINVKQNQSDEYPLKLQTDSSTALYSTMQSMWIKNHDNQYTFIIQGTCLFSSEALKEEFTEVQQLDENYIVSGDTYVREIENREDKSVPIYKPTEEDIKAKMSISFINPLSETQYQNEKI